MIWQRKDVQNGRRGLLLLACQRSLICFFFFQAEDGIRDRNVTGVQTCALPIWVAVGAPAVQHELPGPLALDEHGVERRSEERRVGKECRSRWSPEHEKKKR